MRHYCCCAIGKLCGHGLRLKKAERQAVRGKSPDAAKCREDFDRHVIDSRRAWDRLTREAILKKRPQEYEALPEVDTKIPVSWPPGR